jgi:Flp pilus assembly protein TadG
MLIIPRPKSPHARAGIAALEMALIAPVLVFVTLGMLEMARAMMVKETLTDAARKGCRTAILANGTNSAVTADINTVLTNNSIPTADITITILVNGAVADVSTATAGSKISVKVAVPIADVAWITPLFMPGNIESENLVMMSQKN